MNHMAILAIFMLLSGCNALPQLYQSVEDIADDNAVQVVISREAIQKQTDVNISVDVKNNSIVSK